MVQKKTETMLEMVDKTEPEIMTEEEPKKEKEEPKKKKLNTYVIVPDNIAVQAETEAEAVKIFKSNHKK